MVLFGHGTVGLFHFFIGSRLFDLQNFIGRIRRFDEHGHDTLKIVLAQPKVPGNFAEFFNFRLAHLPIGLGNAEQKVQHLQPHLVAGSLHHKITNSLGGYFPFFDDLVERPENGIGLFLAIGAQKILAHIVELPLIYLSIGLDDDRAQRKQVQLKIGRRNRLPRHIFENGTRPATGTSQIIQECPHDKSQNRSRKPKHKITEKGGYPLDHASKFKGQR